VNRAASTPSEEDLRLLSEHLHYEIQMTFDLASVVLTGGYATAHPILRNAMVEAFTIHVRQLIDFFWSGRTRRNPRDAFAADYFDSHEWVSIRPNRPRELGEDLWQKVGWGVVHLTYGRAHVTAEQKEWRPVEICVALTPAVLCFVDNVDPSKLDPAWFDHVRPCVERFHALLGNDVTESRRVS
jgi:hypothetical protein